MPFATPKPDCALTVFRGSTGKLLHAAGEDGDADFTSIPTILQVRLGAGDYKLVTENPLLEAEILYSVGEEMMTKFAPLLAQEYARTGIITKQSGTLARAQMFADRATYAALKRGKAAMDGARETKINLMKNTYKCVAGLSGAGIGLASTVPTFGATSIPAVLGAWSALTTAIDAVYRACNDVETSEKRAVAQLKKSQEIVEAREASSKTTVQALARGTLPQGAQPATSTSYGKYPKEAAHGVAKALGVYKIPGLTGRSIGLSLDTATSELSEFKRKLGNLYETANRLHDKLNAALDKSQQLKLSIGGGESAEFERITQFIIDAIGDGTRNAGVRMISRGHQHKMSISWIMAYREEQLEAVEKMDKRLKELKSSASGSHALLREQGIGLFLTVGQWVGGKSDLLQAQSVSDVAKAAGLLTNDGGAKGSGIAGFANTAYGWANTAYKMKDTIADRLKKKEEAADKLAAAEPPKSAIRKKLKSLNDKLNDYGATAVSIGSAAAGRAGA